MRNIYLFLLLAVFFSCADPAVVGRTRRPLPEKITYRYDCLTESSEAAHLIDMLSETEQAMNGVLTQHIEVTTKEQNSFGESFLREARKDPSFVIDKDAQKKARLNVILQELLSVRKNPSGLIYSIHLIENNKEVNAYTVGGKIFVNKALLSHCQHEDQIYAIIGHEIGHNEMGHLANVIKDSKLSNAMFGEFGDVFFMAKQFITSPFNQKSELEADYYGINLMYQLGFDPCKIKQFWDQMSTSGTPELLHAFLSTHPHSQIRSNCISRHLSANFNLNCD